MPKLIRLYIQSIAIGFALSATFTGVMVWQDVAHLGHLILGSTMGWVAVAMMVMFFGVLFSGVQFGIRIMMMAGEDEGPRGGLRQHVTRAPATPVPVRAEAKAAPRPGQPRR